MLEVSDAYRAAAASSGILTASQLRARPEVERHTEMLQKQKVALRDIIGLNGRVKNSMRDVYRDQLRLQRMTVTSRGLDKFGREISDITVPKDVPRQLDTINNKLKFARSLTQSAATQMINWGKNTQWAGRQLTVGFTYPMSLFAAGTAKMAYDIDKQITRVQKVYDSTLGNEARMVDKAAEAQKLRADSYALATEMARKYGAAATDVLSVEAELAATGLNGTNLLSATKETTRIATLGDLDFQAATDMTISLQTAFKDTIRTSQDLTEAFDFMNAVENATSLSIKDIAEATPRAASALAGLGVNVKEMTVLMTSMRSAGIDAAEGANALKSVSTRIINPGVLKGAQPFFEGIVDLSKISKQSGGNLYKFVQLLGEATKDMANYERQQGFAKLFGAYQYNRGAAVVKNMTDAMHNLNDESNQTARAMKVASMSAAELASIADNEVAKKMNSLSGRFDAAWQSVKVTAAKIGEAFLPIMTDILRVFDKGTNAAMKFFGAMPDWASKTLGIVAALAAIAGPVVMMTGLFVNMFGQSAKLLSVGTKFNILNRAQMAAEIQAKNTTKAYQTEAMAVSMLTDEIVALAAAQGYSTGVGQNALANGVNSRRSFGAEPGLPAGITMRPDSMGRERYYYGDSKQGVPGGINNAALANVKKYKNEQKLIERSTAKAVTNIKAAGVGADGVAVASEKTSRSWNTTKLASGVFAASMVSHLIPGVKEFSGYIDTAAMSLMGMSVAKDAFGTKNAEKVAQRSAAKTVAMQAAGTGLMATRWGKVGGLIAKAGVRLKFFGAGLGVAAVGAAALATTTYLIYKKTQESSKRQDEVNKSVDAWAKALGGVAEGYKTIAKIDQSRNSEGVSAAELADKFKKDDSMKGVREAFSNAKGDDSEMNMLAMGEYIKMIDKTNLTARDAQVGLESMFLAAGYGAEEAQAKAEEYFNLLGDKIDNKEYATLWNKQITELFSAGGDKDNRIDGMVKELSDSMAKAPDALVRGRYMSSFQTAMSGAMNTAMSGAMTDGFKGAFDSVGADTDEEIKGLVSQWGQVATGEMQGTDFWKGLGLDPDKDMDKIFKVTAALNGIYNNDDVRDARDAEADIAETLAKQYGIELDIYNLENLRKALAADRYVYTQKEAKAEYDRMVQFTKITGKMDGSGNFLSRMGELTKGALDGSKEVTEQQKLQILNNLRTEMGLKKTVTLSDMFKRNTAGTAAYERQVASAVDHTNDILKARRSILDDFKESGAADAYKSVWTSVNQAVADEISAGLEAQQQAQTDALDASIDAEEAALDNRADHWAEYYDNAIEQAEKFYDKRIEKVQNLIEAEEAANDARQRIFEAESQRLQRMADMQNSNIDFNMALDEGRLDEAAKLMNDSVAKSAADQMDDEAKRADYELEVRRASLEKQIELLEKQRDRRVDALEDARQAKEKALAMARDRAQKENEIERKSLAERQKMQSHYYDMALAELNSYIPTSQADLERHIKDLNKRYSKYGVKLEAQSGEWSQFISKNMNTEMALAANRLKSDVNWAGAGFDAAEGMMKGMAQSLGMNGAEFRKWLGVSMGKRPEGPQSGTGINAAEHGMGPSDDRHSGGLMGTGGGKRTGFSGAYSPHNEMMVNAQKGEYMIKKSAVNQYGVDFFDKVNDGRFGTGGASGGPGQLMGAFMGNAMKSAVSSKMDKMVQAKYMKYMASLGGMFSGGTGNYSLPGVKPWVLEAANYLGGKFGIGTIGGVGDRASNPTSDHPRGLALDFMTQDINKGNALSNEAIKRYKDLDASYLIWQARIHSFDSRGWQPYSHPSGATDPTSMHMDHVHLSFNPTGDVGDLPQSSGGSGGSGYVPGPGGRFRPVAGGSLTQGLHPTNAVDIGVNTGTPVRAIADGTVTGSYDIPGYEPRQPDGGNGYRSYGRVITMNHGPYSSLYAHLSRRSVTDGMSIKGGSTIGYSGDTGNSSGAHLHFGVPGGNPYAFLRQGGTIRHDNTSVLAHRGETMLSAPLTRDLKEGVKGGGDQYNVTLDLRGAMIKEDVDLEKALDTWWDKKDAKTGRKRIVK